ncbi:MAG: hypothetical protein AAF802_32365, partial [Planctomycetota bacterium]
IPSRLGPRHCCQSSASEVIVPISVMKKKAMSKRVRYIIIQRISGKLGRPRSQNDELSTTGTGMFQHAVYRTIH